MSGHDNDDGHDDMRFRQGQRVLCYMGEARGGFCPGTIVKVGYRLSASDIHGSDSDNRAGDIMPYQVRLHFPPDAGLICVYSDEDEVCCELDADNLVFCNVHEDIMEQFMTPLVHKKAEEANRLLRLAVQVRRPTAAKWLARKAKIPIRLIGQELLNLAVQCKQDYIVSDPEDDGHVESLVSDLQELVQWLKADGGAALERHSDKHRRGIEHIAAINGDVPLLVWLLTHEWVVSVAARASRRDDLATLRDDHQRTPLHLAALNNRTQIIDAYVRGEDSSTRRLSGNTWLLKEEDFNAHDADGKTALQLARDPGTVASLHAYRKCMLQDLLNCEVRDSYGSCDFVRLQQLVADYDLSMDEAMQNHRHDRSTLGVAAENGQLDKLKWLLLAGGSEPASFVSEDGFTLMELAAGWSSSTRDDMKRKVDCLRPESDEEGTRRKWRKEDIQSREMFYEHEWDGQSDLVEAMTAFAKSKGCYYRLFSRHIEEDCLPHCNGTASKLPVVRWLIRQGLPSPACEFIVHECDVPTARLLLEYRFLYCTAIDDVLLHKAPVAAELIKEYLCCSKADAHHTPESIAMLCASRSTNDPLSFTDLGRLKLLEWLVCKKGVSLADIRTLDGETILHEAVYNNELAIAIWISARCPQLAHTVGLTSGKMPVHLALELAEKDNAMWKFMIMHAGEGRGYDAWCKDARAWTLPDRNGVTVRQYAKTCTLKQVREHVTEGTSEHAFLKLIDICKMPKANEALLNIHFDKNNLGDYQKKFGNSSDVENRFVYGAIGLGRRDVLEWYERRFYKDDRYDYPGLAHMLDKLDIEETRRHKWTFKCLPRVYSSCSTNVGVEDYIEIHTTFSEPEQKLVLTNAQSRSSRFLDGRWELSGWKAHSNDASMVSISNCVVIGTEEPGLLSAVFSFDKQDRLNLCAPHYGQAEIWTEVSSQTRDGETTEIELKREYKRDDGYVMWTNAREIKLNKVGVLDSAASNPKWRIAHVIEATETDLKVEYAGFGSSLAEWIPRNSDRINQTGITKSPDVWYGDTYMWACCGTPQQKNMVMTGREWAVRCEHHDVVAWIDEATAPAKLRQDLEAANREFIKLLFGQAETGDLEAFLDKTKRSTSSKMTPREREVLDKCKDELYVLDTCWGSQPSLGMSYSPPSSLIDGNDLRNELETMGLLRSAARVGRLDRVKWMMERKQVPATSEHALGALFDAAHHNRVELCHTLISNGVNPVLFFAKDAHMNASDFRRERDWSEEEKSLLECATSNLSGAVVCYLLDSHHVPKRFLQPKLLFEAVGWCAVYGEGAAERRKQKARDRLVILQKLTAHGLRLTHTNRQGRSIMSEALKRIAMDQAMVGSDGSIRAVQITKELVQWLCSQGCDLNLAMEQDRMLSGLSGGLPQWLTDLCQLSQSTWAVSDAIGRGATAKELEALVVDCAVDVSSITDQNGRKLIEVATLKNQPKALEWLVKTKGADLDAKGTGGKTAYELATQLGLHEMLKQIQWLRKWAKKNSKLQKAKQRKMHAAALCVQLVFRRFVARKQLRSLRDSLVYGVWAGVVSSVSGYEAGSCPSHFGLSWAHLRMDLEFQVEEDLSFLTDAALMLEANVEVDDSNSTALELEQHSITTGAQPIDSLTAPKVNRIQLTADALKWLRKQKDEKYRLLFTSRLEQLAQGDRSYCLSKRLKGSSRHVIETKLDAGQRIIWTQRGNEILVWYVCKHKHISRCLQLVEQSYERVRAASKFAEEKDDGGEKVEPEVLINPTANVPLKIHSLPVSELAHLATEVTWIPPLKLTAQEQSIVTKKGTVLLLGRSGTGKTLCVCNRMARDRKCYGELRQLFVAGTQRICDFVKSLQSKTGEDVSNAKFIKMSSFISEIGEMQESAGEIQVLVKSKFVDYKAFEQQLWNKIKGNEKKLDALQVWTQIRTFIKGSFEAAQQRQPLAETQYLGLSQDRCRLDEGARKRAYAIFSRYKIMASENGLWDDCDRTMQVVNQLQIAHSHGAPALFDRIYADEVQDTTQAEIGLLLLAVGGHCDALFLAGDTAQAIAHGVDFRFEEVRSAVHMISGGKQRVERWEKLSHNFRSHEGILRTSNLVLQRLHCTFPNAAAKLPLDTGVVLGPRPVLLKASPEQIKQLMNKNERLRLLMRDEHRHAFLQQLGAEFHHACFGIREAKGLEFQDVAIVDFFSSLQDDVQQKAWKRLLLETTPAKQAAGSARMPTTMELELKLLYTAITRSCHRLYFIETSETQGGEAWSRCLLKEQLAQNMQADVANILHTTKPTMMVADDWLVEGAEIASLAEDDKMNAPLLLQTAISCFQKAGDGSLETRARAQLKAIELEQVPQRDSMSDVEQSETLQNAANAVVAYLGAGMPHSAASICEEYCNVPQLSELGNRIRRLGPVTRATRSTKS